MSDKPSPIRVLAADDLPSHRRRLARILESAADIELVGLASTRDEAVRLALERRPEVVLLDIEMDTRFAGIEAARSINASLPTARIIVLTIHDDEDAVIAAFQTGIVDYLLKTADDGTIVSSIRSAAKGTPPMRPLVMQVVRKELARSREMEERLQYTLRLLSDLTPSELEILRHLYRGEKYREIAEDRFVSVGTIKNQVHSILKKCHHTSSRDLVDLLRRFHVFEILDEMRDKP